MLGFSARMASKGPDTSIPRSTTRPETRAPETHSMTDRKTPDMPEQAPEQSPEKVSEESPDEASLPPIPSTPPLAVPPPPPVSSVPSPAPVESRPQEDLEEAKRLERRRQREEDDAADAEVVARHSSYTWTVVGIALGLGSIATSSDLGLFGDLLKLAVPVLIGAGLMLGTARWMGRDRRLLRAARWWRKHLAQYGGGFYGFVALGAFCALEAQSALETWQRYDGWELLRQFRADAFWGFSVQSMMNLVQASGWPWFGWTRFGTDLFGLVFIAWLLFRGGEWAVGRWAPEVLEDELEPDAQGD